VSAFVYTPSEWQTTFHHIHITHKVDEVLGAGAAGPGKTTAMLMDIAPRVYEEHRRCQQSDHPEHIPWGGSAGWALHLRRTEPMLSQSIVNAGKYFRIIDPKVRSWDGGLMWEFQSGYKYQFGHCADEDHWERYYSNAYDWIGFDELTQFLQIQYDMITLRKRSSDPVLAKVLKVCSMSNPVVRRENQKFLIRDPHWVRRRFVDRHPAGNKVFAFEVKLMTGGIEHHRLIYLPAKLTDNPDKEFVAREDKNLSKAAPHLRKALRDGDWYVTFGSFYAEHWDARMHIIPRFKIPEHWPVFRSMDWGFKNFGTVGWWAMDDDDNLIKFKEWTFKGRNAETAAKDIIEIERAMKMHLVDRNGHSRITGPADTQLWEDRGDKTQHHQRTKAETMAAIGVNWIPANKARKANAQLFIERLEDHRHHTTLPGIMFFEECVNTIRTIPGIQTEEGDSECPADGGDDHWHDETLYACSYASMGRRGIAKRRREEEDWQDEDRKVKVGVRTRGSSGYGS
jgi:hypothetical protein